jgi:hypothetical protein
MEQRYFYRDIVTKKTKYTKGKFVGWSDRTGLLNVHYAGFARRSDVIWVPEYCVMPETKKILPPTPSAK